MARGQLWETLDRAADEVGGIDFVDTAWARGQSLRRRRQGLSGLALLGSAIAVVALVLAALAGPTDGVREPMPAGSPSGTTSATVAGVSVRTLAGAEAGFGNVGALAVGPTGTLYVSEGSRVRMVTPQGAVTTLTDAAGTPLPPTGDVVDGMVGFGRITVGADGTVYVVDGRDRIRRIAPDGTTSDVLEGTGSPFSMILGISVDAAGRLYVADNGWVHTVTSDGKVTGVGKCLEPTSIGACGELAVDSRGTIHFRTDEGYLVRTMAPDGQVSTLAGGPYASRSVDPSMARDGVGAQARFGRMYGFAFDPTDSSVYISDWTGLRKVTPDGTVTTLVGASQIVGPMAIGADGILYAAVRGSILIVEGR